MSRVVVDQSSVTNYFSSDWIEGSAWLIRQILQASYQSGIVDDFSRFGILPVDDSVLWRGQDGQVSATN